MIHDPFIHVLSQRIHAEMDDVQAQVRALQDKRARARQQLDETWAKLAKTRKLLRSAQLNLRQASSLLKQTTRSNE